MKRKTEKRGNYLYPTEKFVCVHRGDKRSEHYWGQWKQAVYDSGNPFSQWRKCESCGYVERKGV